MVESETILKSWDQWHPISFKYMSLKKLIQKQYVRILALILWYDIYPVWALFSLHPYIFWIEILLFIEYDDAICMIIIAEPLLLSREQCFSLFGTKGETYIWQYLLCYRVVVRHVRFVDCWVLWMELFYVAYFAQKGAPKLPSLTFKKSIGENPNFGDFGAT